jgi:hypothetical protein
MAEVEISVLIGQCLDRRIGKKDTLDSEVTAWEAERNERRPRLTGASRSPTPGISRKGYILCMMVAESSSPTYQNFFDELLVPGLPISGLINCYERR